MKFDYIYGENVSGKYPKVRTSIEKITPEVAEKMLESNIANRKMPREAIEEGLGLGEWMLNGATIVFSCDGVLLDGQTRLKACVDSGVPIETIVVRGIDPEARLVMDCGSTRTIQNQLQMLGVKNFKVAAAIAKAMYRREHWGMESALSGSHADMTTRSVIAYELSHDAEVQELVKKVRDVKLRHKSLKTGALAVLASEFSAVDEDDCEEFFAQLAMKTEPSQPVLMLINKLDEDAKSKTGKLPQRTVNALVVKTWNAWLNGEDLTSNALRFRAGGKAKEGFPQIAHY